MLAAWAAVLDAEELPGISTLIPKLGGDGNIRHAPDNDTFSARSHPPPATAL
jgi:hypothetical protein